VDAKPVSFVLVGVAKYYAPGVMERVARTRGMALAGYVDGVALLPCEHVGREAWLVRPGSWPPVVEGPFLVVDCAASRHYSWRVAEGDVVEVGWETARRWGMRGPVKDVVVFVGSKNQGIKESGNQESPIPRSPIPHRWGRLE
jgi:hypothetical protein